MSVALRFLFPSLFIALCCARIGATQDSNTNYRALVESYRRNGGDEIDRVLRVRREVIDRAVDDALSAPAGWAWNELRAAAMLHSEAAISALRAKDSPACDLHITFAQRLLDRVVSLSRAQQDFAWRWYMIAPHLVGSLGEKGIGKRLDAYAREKWGRDTARTQYLRGLEFESKFGGDNGQEM